MSHNLPEPDQQQYPPSSRPFRAVAFSISSLFKSKAFWRLVLIVSIVDLGIVLLLGFAILLIAVGLEATIIRICSLNRPMARLVARIAGLPDGQSLFPELSISIWQQILVTGPALFWLVLTALGLWILFKDGFAHQNLIYYWLTK